MATPGFRPPQKEADLEARITWLPGRNQPARSGIQPIHDFYGGGELYISLHVYPETGAAPPGIETKVRLWLLAPQAHAGRLHPDLQFTVREGGVVAARGRIVQVLNQDVARDS
jgi:hypothetical protein